MNITRRISNRKRN